MIRTYFTFGSDERYPFGINDYVAVLGEDIHDCIAAFKTVFPNRPGSDSINCAFYYSEDKWNDVKDTYYKNVQPARVLVSDKAYGCKPKNFEPLQLYVPTKNAIVFIEAGNSYIDYKILWLKHGCMPDQGGYQIACKPFEEGQCLVDLIPKVFDFIWSDPFLSAVILQPENK